MSDHTSDPSDIERELAQTRARLGTHLDELTRRLSPGQLVDQALDYLRNGQGAVFANNLGRQVRDNPLPVALTGLGLAWLAVAGTRPGYSTSRAVVPYDEGAAWSETQDDMAERARRAGESVIRAANETQEAFRERVEAARGGVLGVVRQANETVADYATRVQQAFTSAQDAARDRWARVRARAHAAQDGAREQWDNVRDTARYAQESARDQFGRVRETARAAQDSAREQWGRVRDSAFQGRDYAARTGANVGAVLTDNPLLLAALSMTAGALLGALLPRTGTEDAYLGDTARQAMGSVREAAADAMQRGASVAEAALHAGYEKAREEGLDPAAAQTRARRTEGNGAGLTP